MSKKYQSARGESAETSVALGCKTRHKSASDIRTLTRVALAAVVGGALSTAQAGGHILGIEGALLSEEGAARILGASRAASNVPPATPPRPVLGLRGLH